MKRAMIDVHAALAPRPDARMILTVHDELLFEVPKDEAEEVAEVVREHDAVGGHAERAAHRRRRDRRELEGREE